VKLAHLYLMPKSKITEQFSSPPFVCTEWRLILEAQDNFTFTFTLPATSVTDVAAFRHISPQQFARFLPFPTLSIPAAHHIIFDLSTDSVSLICEVSCTIYNKCPPPALFAICRRRRRLHHHHHHHHHLPRGLVHVYYVLSS
jgi:hypothetical protein